ncbi:hypothetical protein HMPREF3036_02461 [Sutterella sp. KLE1602]|nr:hypothetical protein HMPREF3036_02461 [Sutterella sp. KLE1602]
MTVPGRTAPPEDARGAGDSVEYDVCHQIVIIPSRSRHAERSECGRCLTNAYI